MKKNQKLTENLFYNKGLNENLYDSIPTAKLVKIKKLGTPVTMSGPRPYVFTHGEFHNAFASTTSTYPHYPNTTKREGDPICDSFRVHIHQELFIACIADGCNWGERPREASNRGKDAFVRSIEANIATVKNFRDLGPLMMAALDESHMAILAEKNDIWMAGTTTLLGGVCVKLADPAVGKEWAFMGVTVGDCKTFMFSSKEKTVVDLTEGNRMNITDPRDPGGRIGPYVGGGDADVRNLMLFHVFLEEGDILFFLSDGVHDNLDPQTLGKDPSDFGLDGKDWDDVDLLAGTKVKTEFMCKTLQDFILNENGTVSTPKIITKKIIKYCMDLTAPSREYMEQNPNNSLGNDYLKYPGKMDHATCIALKIGTFNIEQEKLREKELELQESLDPNIWPF